MINSIPSGVILKKLMFDKDYKIDSYIHKTRDKYINSPIYKYFLFYTGDIESAQLINTDFPIRSYYIKDGNKIIGWIKWCEIESLQHIPYMSLFVEPKHIGKGNGISILANWLNKIFSEGIERAQFYSVVDNPVNKVYFNFCKDYFGQSSIPIKQSIKLRDGKYYDEYIWTFTKNDWIEGRSKINIENKFKELLW